MECIPELVNFWTKSPKKISTEKDKEMHGMHFKCMLILNEYFQDEIFKTENIRDSKIFLKRDSRTCYEKYKTINHNDLRTFFEIWKCMIKFKNFLLKVPGKFEFCKIRFGLKEDEKMSPANQNRYGCFLKCCFDVLGLYRHKNSYNFELDNFLNIHHNSTLDFCENSLFQKFEPKHRHSCEYFSEFEHCTKGQTFVMLKKIVNLLVYTWNYVLDFNSFED